MSTSTTTVLLTPPSKVTFIKGREIVVFVFTNDSGTVCRQMKRHDFYYCILVYSFHLLLWNGVVCLSTGVAPKESSFSPIYSRSSDYNRRCYTEYDRIVEVRCKDRTKVIQMTNQHYLVGIDKVPNTSNQVRLMLSYHPKNEITSKICLKICV